MQELTNNELSAIRAHAVNSTTRAVASEGRTLTFEQLDELRDKDVAFLRTRLGVRTVAYSGSAELVPFKRSAQENDEPIDPTNGVGFYDD